MVSRLKRAVLVLLLLFLSLALVWLGSTEAQRNNYLVALGLTDALGPPPGQDLSLSGLGFAVRRSEPPSAPWEISPPGSIPRDHPDGVGTPCRSNGVANPTHKTQRQVYRWMGTDGKPVFSDRPPPDGQAEVVGQTAEAGVGMFSTDYQFLGARRDGEFEQVLSANIDGVFRFLSKDLGLATAEALHVRLTVIDGKQRFISHRDSRTTKLSTTSGFYTFDGNEAVVRWMGPERTMAVARHEVTHLALGNWLGNTPLWLNEGLAEFVEQLSFAQSFARSADPTVHLRKVQTFHRSDRLPTLRRFIAMDRNDWNRIGDDIAYPYAWSLVHFLLSSPQSRPVVTRYLNALSQNRCRPFDHEAHLEAAYPGGLAGLESAWKEWLSKAQPAIITF